MEVKPFLREATQRLVEVVGAETGAKFQGLMFRLMLGLNDSDKEFYAEQRRLITSHGDYAYDAAGEYRKTQYMQAAVCRLWRAVYGYSVMNWFSTHTQAANYYLVNVDDLKDLLAFHKKAGSPSLKKRLFPKDDRQIWDQVTPESIIPSEAAWRRLEQRANALVLSENYRYLIHGGYSTKDELVSDLRTYGIIRMSLQDWLPEDDRYREAFQCMRSYLCDFAKQATAKKRARAIKHTKADGTNVYQSVVVNIEDLVSETDHHPLEKLANVNEESLIDHAVHAEALRNLQAESFTKDEKRILNALLDKPDAEIESMMEGEEPEEWLEWLCDQLEVDFVSFSNKALKAIGSERTVEA